MAVNLDRFAQGLRDPQDTGIRPQVLCAGCGQSVESGEYVFVLPDGKVTHDDFECFYDAMRPERVPVEEVLA